MNTNIINFLINSALDQPLDKFENMNLAAANLSAADLQALTSNNSIKLRDYVISEQSKHFNTADYLLAPNDGKTFLAAEVIFTPR